MSEIMSGRALGYGNPGRGPVICGADGVVRRSTPSEAKAQDELSAELREWNDRDGEFSEWLKDFMQ